MAEENVLAVSCDVHFALGRRGRTRIESEPVPPPHPAIPGTIPRVARVMALAIHFDELLRAGEVANYTDLAGLTGLSRPRITQIMNLLHLAPDIQEQILFLPRTVRGSDPIVERDLWPITAMIDWEKQRAAWRKLPTQPELPRSATPQRVPFSNRRTTSERETPSALQTSPNSARSSRRSPDS